MKQRIVKGIGIFLSIAGLIGVIFELLTMPAALRSIGFTVLFGAAFVLGSWILLSTLWLKIKASKALPPIDELDEITVAYYVEQATPDDIYWIAELESRVYSHEDAVPERVLKEWYQANPTGFSVIRMQDGHKVGHIDILPIRPATLADFLEGNLVERDIRGDSLISPSERDSIRELYIESIIVVPPKGISNAPAIVCVLAGFLSLVQRICDPSKVEHIYAIAASSAGERLLTRLGFDLIRSAEARTDHHNFYAARFQHLASNISRLCEHRIEDKDLLKELLTEKSKGV